MGEEQKKRTRKEYVDTSSFQFTVIDSNSNSFYGILERISPRKVFCNDDRLLLTYHMLSFSYMCHSRDMHNVC